MRGKSLTRIWHRIAAELALIGSAASAVFKTRRIQYVALAAVVTAGSAYALGLAHGGSDSPSAQNAAANQSTADTPEQQQNQEASSNLPATNTSKPGSNDTQPDDTTASSNSVTTTVNSSTTSEGTKTTVTVNGQNVPLPSSGIINKNIRSSDGTTHINASVHGSDGSSSVNIHVNSSSSKGDSDDSP